jgi:hypothetical protein
MMGASAQDVFLRGDKVINAGLGFFPVYLDFADANRPNLSLTGSFEYCLFDEFFDKNGALGVGGYLNYSSSKAPSSDAAGFHRLFSVVIGARAAFHYQFAEKLDTYAGGLIGYDLRSYDSANTSSPFNPGIFVGARYYITDFIGLFAETGFGVNVLEAGLAFKF